MRHGRSDETMGKRRGGLRTAGGFTLVELMVVVSILAILAAIATVSYVRYARRAHVSEAYNMLGMIRMRQESYRAEFSQYCDVSSGTHDGTSGSSAGYWPGSAPGRTPVDFYSGLPPEWTQLGVRPTGQVYFRYETVAGNPGVTPSWGGGLGYNGSVNQDAWWVAHAFGDLDGNGVRSTFEAVSMANGVWVTPNEAE
jgi:prepilin-type N-terminal cleavage/methylation domain-containing protein